MAILKLTQLTKSSRLKIPDGDDYASLNGLLHEKLQDIPQEGDKIKIADLQIIVEKVSKNIAQKIRIERIKT